jgi:hypothetical protein
LDEAFGVGALWLADGTNDSITRIDPLPPHEVKIFSVGNPVLRVGVDPDSRAVWGLIGQPPSS